MQMLLLALESVTYIADTFSRIYYSLAFIIFYKLRYDATMNAIASNMVGVVKAIAPPDGSSVPDGSSGSTGSVKKKKRYKTNDKPVLSRSVNRCY